MEHSNGGCRYMCQQGGHFLPMRNEEILAPRPVQHGSNTSYTQAIGIRLDRSPSFRLTR